MANLEFRVGEFRVGEIKRCVANIDTYDERFQRLVDAEKSYRNDPYQIRSGLPSADPREGLDFQALTRPTMDESSLSKLRTRVVKSAVRFFKRSLKAELIDRVRFLDVRDSIGLTPEEM
ncbi:MAG TPA: hypothetical protein EYQ75_24740 [Planctomycetaceae bacterium]|nr:hypothetical protein [Planctomycetaceae bacterium]